MDEVIDVMQENISKVIERGERLDDLQDKSGESQWDFCVHQTNEGGTSSKGNTQFGSLTHTRLIKSFQLRCFFLSNNRSKT